MNTAATMAGGRSFLPVRIGKTKLLYVAPESLTKEENIA